MPNYITIDGGTTNTRISLAMDGSIIDTLRFHVGARNGIENEKLLKTTIQHGISRLLENHNLRESDITRILASGMITSEYGLITLDHITAPAGIDELHHTMLEAALKDISNIPFVFVRGIKTGCSTLHNADMMRGEETELMGVLQGEGVYILLGSHSKIIEVDSSKRIVNFKTMLTGEMLSALSENTILKSAVALNNQSIDRAFLLEGFQCAKQFGINNALFKVRILKTLFDKTANEIYSFYLGIVLCDEIQYVLALKAKKIIVTGQPQIKEAVVALLRQLASADLTFISEKDAANATARGMIKIFEHHK